MRSVSLKWIIKHIAKSNINATNVYTDLYCFSGSLLKDPTGSTPAQSLLPPLISIPCSLNKEIEQIMPQVMHRLLKDARV